MIRICVLPNFHFTWSFPELSQNELSDSDLNVAGLQDGRRLLAEEEVAGSVKQLDSQPGLKKKENYSFHVLP